MTVAAWVQDSTGGAPGRLGYHSARSWRHAGVTPSRQNDAGMHQLRLCITRIIDRRTQYHRVSAAVKHPGDAELHCAPNSTCANLLRYSDNVCVAYGYAP